MTEKSPEVLPTADLTPISPLPLHLSSPIVIPALQDQADTLCTMSLPGAVEAFTASTFATEHVEAGQNGLSTISIQDDDHSSDAAMSEESDLYDDNDDDNRVEDRKEGTTSIKDKDGNTQQLIHQNSATETQDVSKTNESSPSSDTSQSLTSQSQVTTSSSHDFTNPAQTVHQTIQNTSQPATKGPQEPHELQNPQEHAVVTPSWAGSTNAPQSSTGAPTENSDHRPSAPNDEIDIQVLVDSIIGNANQSTSQPPANPPAVAHVHAVSLPDGWTEDWT